jgi:hypothetical protein
MAYKQPPSPPFFGSTFFRSSQNLQDKVFLRVARTLRIRVRIRGLEGGLGLAIGTS